MGEVHSEAAQCSNRDQRQPAACLKQLCLALPQVAATVVPRRQQRSLPHILPPPPTLWPWLLTQTNNQSIIPGSLHSPLAAPGPLAAAAAVALAVRGSVQR